MRPAFVALLSGVLTFVTYYLLLGGSRQAPAEKALPAAQPVDTTPASSNNGVDTQISPNESEADKIERLREKLKPVPLQDVDGTLVKHQFLHLHHMKTGGTSMDGLIGCAMHRAQYEMGYTLNYMNIHECGQRRYEACLSGKDQKCLQKVKDAALMSYCAPLKDLSVFEWKPTEVHALTVLRHPVDRVWSMYRFQTKRCYQCKTLEEVYAGYDKADSYEVDMCASQLMNHMTRNLLLNAVEGTDEERIKQAIDDMENYFTFVGLTEDLPATAAIAGKVFPWLAESVNGTTTKCPFPHKNSSPSNNNCGPGNSHWDLPDHPDEATAELIRQHNQLDMKVYEAAVKHFELQKKALGL